MNESNPIVQLVNNEIKTEHIKYNNSLMFAFTARSGSTAITDAIARMDLAKSVNEIFNPRGPAQYLYDNYGGCDIIDYINNIHTNTMLTDMMIFKTDYRDLEYVIKKYNIKTLFPSLKVVYIERKDKVMQAVSVYKAVITNHWHQTGEIYGKQEAKVRGPDINKIIAYKNRFEKECDEWMEFFASYAIQPYKLFYEDFDDDNDLVIRALYRYITGYSYDRDIKFGYSKMRDEVSEEWAKKVKQAL